MTEIKTSVSQYRVSSQKAQRNWTYYMELKPPALECHLWEGPKAVFTKSIKYMSKRMCTGV